MTPISGRFLGAQLCQMFGLDPNIVVRVSIIADVKEAAYVEVVLLADSDKLDEFVTRRYTFVDSGEEYERGLYDGWDENR